MQRSFVRKELESYTVETSSLLESAVEVAVGNCLRKRGKQRAKLWKKKPRRSDPTVSASEAKAVKRAMAEKAPWTPWQGGG